LSTSITWERTPHPVRRPAFSSHLNGTTLDGQQIEVVELGNSDSAALEFTTKLEEGLELLDPKKGEEEDEPPLGVEK
jgi:hypothetical protein